MAEEKVCKNDIAVVFKRLRSIQANKVCFDCGAKNPTWASVTYGVFICMDCSAVHRSLGVHLSFVRSTQLDTNWTWLQLRAMQVGGNHNAGVADVLKSFMINKENYFEAPATRVGHLTICPYILKLMSFFQQHGCASQDAQQKYNSRAAQLYREKLHNQAAAAMRLHGTKLHIDIPHVEPPHSPEKPELDFFKDITDANLYSGESESLKNSELRNGSCIRSLETNSNDSSTNLDISFDVTNSNKQEPRKSTISGRKPATAKKGLGGKKGLGAQRVNANFEDIEKEAEKLDRLREQAETEAVAQVPPEEQEKQIASVRLAYKDLSLEQKKTEEKLRQVNPQKAEQLERLGMGFGGRHASHVTHSAASEMKLITQEAPTTSQKKFNQDLDLEDDFEFMSFTSGPPKYGDSPFMSRSSSDKVFKDLSSPAKPPLDLYSMVSSSKENNLEEGRARKSASTSNIVSTDEAQKKFGNAKGISSDQFFGSSRDSEFERKANLTRFEGSSSISSEDYFGGDSRRSASASSYAAPNLYDIKEGVRDGVTKVAGRLSSIANGVMSSLQRK